MSVALRSCALVLLMLAAGCAGVQDGPRSATTPLAVDPALLGAGGNGGQRP